MGGKGFPPKPTALKELEGNPGRRSLNKFEPKPNPVCDTPPPGWMEDPRAQHFWIYLVDMLGRIGVLTEADLPLLGRYCSILSDWHKVREVCDKATATCYPIYDGQKVDKDGKRVVKKMAPLPQFKQKFEISEHLLRIEQHFGMTPAARSRLLVDPGTGIPMPGDPPKKDPFDD